MPSQGFYVRHVKGIQFDNVTIRTETEDRRPAFVLDDVQEADFFRVRTPRAPETPTFALRNVTQLSIHMCNGVKDTDLQRVDSQTL